MPEPRKMTTPSQINKFVYCPYQWYYEQVYGAKELRRQYTARNEKLGLTDTQLSNFTRGNDFHRRFAFERGGLGRVLWVVVLVVACALAVAWWYVVRR